MGKQHVQDSIISTLATQVTATQITPTLVQRQHSERHVVYYILEKEDEYKTALQPSKNILDYSFIELHSLTNLHVY